MKKRLLSTLLLLCLLPGLLCVGVSAQAEAVLSVSTCVDGVELRSVEINGRLYLFLPASADIKQLFLCFASNGDALSGVWLSGENGTVCADDLVDLTRVAAKNTDACYVMSAETQTGLRVRLCVMQGAVIPSLYLHSGDAFSEGRDWVDRNRKNVTSGSMELVGADGTVIHAGGLTQLKARGNSTFVHYPKKAYQIKLEKKADLLGTGEKGKTWVLLANYGDATMMHDRFFKALAARLGMNYVADCDWVNLYYDGEYRGVYLLGEKNAVGETGVDITDMEDAYDALNPGYGDDVEIAEALNCYGSKYLYTEGLAEPEELTGGYLIEKNHDFVDEACGFFTRQGVAFNVKSPEYAGQAAMAYISEYYQAFEDAVYATDPDGNYTGYNTQTGKYFYEYVDLQSLVQTFLMQELALNPDGYISSMYFYKDAGGILYAGPIWDQDLTLGTGWTKYITPTVIDYHYLAKALIRIPVFREAVETYFTDVFAPTVESFLAPKGDIALWQKQLSANAAMNDMLWPYVRIGDPANEGHLWPPNTNYYAVTVDMTRWMQDRMDVLRQLFEREAAYTRGFSDVPADSWSAKAVAFTTTSGLLNGVSEERFDPTGTATRGMLFTVLARMEGQDTTPGDGEHWQQPGLDWAVENGISDGSAPDSAITREQLATMLYRFADSPAVQGSIDGFRDAQDVNSWAREAMCWAVSQGIFRGSGDGCLNPRGTATRAEIAQVIMNFRLTQA